MGAYFVRRNSRDPLYRKVLERYVAMATAAGVTQAVFPEGGPLARRTAAAAPKLGILDYMLRSFDPAGDRDIVFVPVGINYDRAFEDRSFLPRARPAAARATGAVEPARDHAALRRAQPLAHGAQPLAPLRLRLRQLRLAGLAGATTRERRGIDFRRCRREERSAAARGARPASSWRGSRG